MVFESMVDCAVFDERTVSDLRLFGVDRAENQGVYRYAVMERVYLVVAADGCVV